MTGRKSPWTAAAVVMAVLKALPGPLLVQVGFTTLMTGPGTYLWEEDANAYATTAPATFERPSAAIVITPPETLYQVGRDPLEDELINDVLVRTQGATRAPGPLFLGVTTATAVDDYLAGVAYDEVDGWDVGDNTGQSCDVGEGPNAGSHICHVYYTPHAGTGTPAAPGAETIWQASVEGTGPLTLDWTLPPGSHLPGSSATDAANDYALVLMNADGSPGVSADLTFGAKASNAVAIQLITYVAAGTVMLAGVLTVVASVLRLGGWMIGLGIAVVVVGAFGYVLLFAPAAGWLVLLGLVGMIVGMKRSWDAQRSDTTTLLQANQPVPSS